jgi:hypothetical protein
MAPPSSASNPCLSAWHGWWLEACCGCGRAAQLPVALLARRLGANRRVDEVANRMRCDGCGARPKSVDLIDSPQREAQGFAGGKPAVRHRLVTAP